MHGQAALEMEMDHVAPARAPTMHGAFFLASPKSERMRAAPTPTNISTNSEPDAEMNGTPASPATARARSV